jgi:hypothetical protein
MIWGQLSRIGENLRRQGIMDLAEGAAVRQGEAVGIWDRRCRIIPDGRYGDFFSFPEHLMALPARRAESAVEPRQRVYHCHEQDRRLG